MASLVYFYQSKQTCWSTNTKKNRKFLQFGDATHLQQKKKVADHETGQTDFFIFSRHDFSSSDMNQNCFSRRKQIITWIVKAENEKALMTSRDRDPVQVYCRIRPLDVPTDDSCVTVLSDTVVQVVPPETSQGYRSGTTKVSWFSKYKLTIF